MDVNSTSSYVNNASSNKGFSGLASGVDTESIVEQMLSGTQAKIDKQEGLKQQIEWKQEIYRDIITQINTFQSQFFGTNSSTNLLSQAFFNAMNAVTSSNAFKVTATSSAATGNVNMEVRRLATSTSLTSGTGVSGKLLGQLDAEALSELAKDQLGTDSDYTVKFEVGSETVEVNLRDVFVDGNTFKSFASTSERDAAIENKLEEAFADVGVTATVKDGVMTLTDASGSEKTIVVSADSGEQGLQRLGLTAGSRSSQNTNNSLTGKINETPTLSFSVTLDDLKKDVQIDLREVMNADGTVDLGRFQTSLQKGLDRAHGSGQIQVITSGDGFELQVSAGRKVMVSSSGGTEVLDALGFKNGQSNRIGMGGSLKDLFFANELQGSTFKFTINGEHFSFTEDDTMSDIIAEINRSGAGVRLVYRTQDDTFTLESSESGAGRTITMTQEEGNLLNALFGSGAGSTEIVTGGRISSGNLIMETIPGAAVLQENEFRMTEGKLTLNVNGTDYSFSVAKKSDGSEYTKSEIITELNKQLEDQFGKGTISLTDDGDLSVTNGAQVTVKVGAVGDSEEAIKQAAKSGDLGIALFGAKGASNVADGDTTLAELGITGLYGKDGSVLSGDTKLSDLATLTDNLAFEDGRIVLTATGSDIQVGDAATMEKLFGVESLDMGVASGEASKLIEGENALVKIDGLLTERSSNSFSINGLNFDLRSITGSYTATSGKLVDGNGNELQPLQPGQYVEDGVLYNADGTVAARNVTYQSADGFPLTSGIICDRNTGEVQVFTGDVATVEVSRNTDQIVDGIKQFIDSYNKLISTLNGYLDEDASYRDYAPLTDAQKKEMSEREIELWEEKAKEGLLRRDSTIETFLQSMRTALYEKPEGCNYALYDLGIETGEWESKGQLVLSADGEARLRQVLESDSAGVLQLFTDAEEGLAVKLNDIIDQTAKISSGSPGTLVQLAGVEGKASETNNTLYSRLKEIDDKIEALKRTYEQEKTRYWNQFNTMEQMISNMNTQSSWLTQMLGG